MDVKEETICRLCLNIANNEFEVIDEVTKEIFNSLLLKINLDVSEDPIMCQDCSDIAKKSYHFIAACINTENLPSTAKEKSKDELDHDIEHYKDVWSSKDFPTCRFCNSRLEEKNFISMDDLMNDAIFVDMLPAFMLEIDISIADDPMICTLCRGELECYFKFVLNCLDIEEKINNYCNNGENDIKHRVRLSNIIRFSSEENLKYSEKYTQVSAIKRETETNDEVNIKGKVCDEVCDKSIKTEEMFIKDEEINLNEDYSTLSLKIYNCDKCTYQAKRKGHLKSHMLSHKNASEVETFKCALCDFHTKHKFYVKSHMQLHKDVSQVKTYKCAICGLQTRYKDNFKKHALTHKDPSEVEFYKCTICDFKTKHKRYLNRHLITHKDMSEITIYRCPICKFETKYKGSIRTHELTHKDALQAEVYKCEKCPFETIRKYSLKRHNKSHKDPSELKTYQCLMCNYKTKYKTGILQHMRTHKNVSYRVRVCNLSDYNDV